MDNIVCPIYQMSQTLPDQIAIETPEKTLTYAELDAALNNHVKILGLFIQPQTHVAFVATTSLASILLLFALFRLKAVACPLSFRTPKEQIKTLAERCSASYLLNADEFPVVTTTCSDCLPIYSSDQLATILMTSGSSGVPKAACHTIQNHISSARGALSPLRCDTATRWLLSLPLFHVGGLAILFRCFMAGGSVVMTDLPLESSLIQCAITHASLVPTQLFRLLQKLYPNNLKSQEFDKECALNLSQAQPTPKQLNLNKLSDTGGSQIQWQPTPSKTDFSGCLGIEQQISARCLLIGGAPLSTTLANQALACHLPIYPTYGMTEMSSLITLAGKTLPYRQLCIDDGEILVCGETLFAGYWDANTQKVEQNLRDGWFSTNDLGTFGPQGELMILGRKDRMFISGGENIQPEEIEQAICELPGILAARVVPTDDLEFGKRPVVYLLEEPPRYTLESLRAALASKLPSFKHPIKIVQATTESAHKLKY